MPNENAKRLAETVTFDDIRAAYEAAAGRGEAPASFALLTLLETKAIMVLGTVAELRREAAIAGDGRFWPAPLCRACWNHFHPTRNAVAVGVEGDTAIDGPGPIERCDECRSLTSSGIYLRRPRPAKPG